MSHCAGNSHTRAHAHVGQKRRLPEGSGRTLHGKMQKIKSYRHQNDNDVGKEHTQRPDPESTEHSLGWRDWVTFTILQIPCRMNVSPEPPLGSLLHRMRTRALAGTATSDPPERPHSRHVASGVRVTADSRGWGRGRQGSMHLGVSAHAAHTEATATTTHKAPLTSGGAPALGDPQVISGKGSKWTGRNENRQTEQAEGDIREQRENRRKSKG